VVACEVCVAGFYRGVSVCVYAGPGARVLSSLRRALCAVCARLRLVRCCYLLFLSTAWCMVNGLHSARAPWRLCLCAMRRHGHDATCDLPEA